MNELHSDCKPKSKWYLWPCYIVLLVIAAVISPSQGIAQEATADPVAQRFRCGIANQVQQRIRGQIVFLTIAIVFRDDPVGCRQVEGIIQSCNDLLSCRELVAFRPVGYNAESQGVRAIQDIVNNTAEPSQIVIGPSDSGVFVRAAELLKWPADTRIPIISPIVTVATGSDSSTTGQPVNSHNAWFFSANVNAKHRTNVMIDLMNRRKIQSLTVLYSDSEFSRQTEAAIKDKFGLRSAQNYASFRFDNVSSANGLLDRIIDERPGALAIIGLRTQINLIYDSFHQKNDTWNAYSPLLFTTIDASQLKKAQLYYPILKAARANEQDDVYALSYDTMTMTGRIIVQQANQTAAVFSPTEFQGQFASLMDGQSQAGSMSGMQFDDFENVAPLDVMTFDDHAAVPLGTPMRALQEAEAFFKARHDRFGDLLLINIALVTLIVLVLSAIDIQRSYIGNKRSIWLTWPFMLLVVVNISSALLVYALLAESQQVRWDSTVAALTIALGYTALLKSTIFQTETGKRIGVQAIYDQFIDWLNTRIMLVKHERSAAIINYVAYRNTLGFLQRRLKSVYRFAESPEVQKKLMGELDAQIDKLVSRSTENVLIQQRIVCATKLMKLMNWRMLQQNRIIPHGVRRWEIVDPEILVDMSAQYIFDRENHPLPILKARVETEIEEDELSNPERAKARREEIDKALVDSRNPQTDVYLYLRFLFVRYNGQANKLVEEGLLPQDWHDRLPMLPRWRRLPGMRRNVTADIDVIDQDQDGESEIAPGDPQFLKSERVLKRSTASTEATHETKP